jgi:hypothetical protein
MKPRKNVLIPLAEVLWAGAPPSCLDTLSSSRTIAGAGPNKDVSLDLDVEIGMVMVTRSDKHWLVPMHLVKHLRPKE